MIKIMIRMIILNNKYKQSLRKNITKYSIQASKIVLFLVIFLKIKIKQEKRNIRSYIIFLLPMESLQLRNIQNIENSLSLLKSRIQKLGKLEVQNQQKINKLILSTIPVVERKLKQSQIHEGMEMKRTFYNEFSQQIRKKNQESRIINEKEVTRSKELLTLMKHHNSLHLKQSRKLNEEKIRKYKELHLNQKKEHMNMVKKKEMQSQAKIQEFHQQKRTELKLRRQYQSKQNQVKIQRLVQKMKEMAKQELELQQKVRASEQSIGKFRSVIRKVDKMKCQEFSKLKSELSPTNKLSNSKSISEAILVMAAKNSI